MESVPEGLVSVSDKVSAELGGIDTVDVGDIVQLWKAYNTNPSVHEGNAGYRLQNFFWRIWSSERLSTSLTGSKLARLFLQISEHTATNTTNSIRMASEESEPHSSSSKSDWKHQHPAGHPSSAVTTTKPPLPPILKKSNSSSQGETQKTTRLLLTGWGGKSVTRKPSNPPTPIPPSRPVAFDEQLQGTTTSNSGARPSQKKTFTVARKAKSSKRRPVLMRRKSSQQSSIPTTRAHSPQFQSPPSDDKALDMSIVQEAEIDEEAVEDSSDEPAAITRITSTALFSSSTMPAPAPDPSAGPAPEPAADTDIEEDPQLPPALLADLKALLHKNTPLPPLRPRSSPPLVGFFSATACRYYDVRNVSQENYEQPKPVSPLVDRDFRARFAEQKRLADEYYAQYYRQKELEEQQMPPLHDNVNADVIVNTDPSLASGLFISHSTEAETEPRAPTRTGTAETTRTGTAETTSPSKSRFGDSHPKSHGASTIATSILASGSGGPHPHLGNQDMFSSGSDTEPLSPPPQTGSASAMAVPVPMQAPGGNLFLQSSALSAPRGPSGLSLLLEQSRSVGQETGIATGDEYLNTEDLENEEP